MAKYYIRENNNKYELVRGKRVYSYISESLDFNPLQQNFEVDDSAYPESITLHFSNGVSVLLKSDESVVLDTTDSETTVPDTIVPEATDSETTVPDTIVPETTVSDTVVPDKSLHKQAVTNVISLRRKSVAVQESLFTAKTEIYRRRNGSLRVSDEIYSRRKSLKKR